MDTIFALATSPGKAGVAVIRVSGPRAFDACEALAGDIPAPRLASLRQLRDHDGALLDEALVLCFAAGASFTGETVVEFQYHGAPAITAALLRRLSGLDGLRIAEPGEFTRRAMENGRLDLAQVEGLADLIDAETEAQRLQAQRVLSGALGAVVEGWRADLVRAAALLAVTIDFADEDIPEDVSAEVLHLLSQVGAAIDHHLTGFDAAERVRSGFEVAIVGAPNVGKSTLLNRLAGRDAAITSEHAGTTRDVIEVRMDLRGLPVVFLDTAGIRETVDPVEEIGIARALDRAARADLRVFLVEGSIIGLAPQAGDIVVRAKCDDPAGDIYGVSGKTGQGVEQLLADIADRLGQRAASAGLATRARHMAGMTQAMAAIADAERHTRAGVACYDLAAEDVRIATRSLESLLGRVDVENLLDEIFSSFCLGK